MLDMAFETGIKQACN